MNETILSASYFADVNDLLNIDNNLNILYSRIKSQASIPFLLVRFIIYF